MGLSHRLAFTDTDNPAVHTFNYTAHRSWTVKIFPETWTKNRHGEANDGLVPHYGPLYGCK